MVIFSIMLVKIFKKIIFLPITLLFLIPISLLEASSPTFQFYPETGIIKNAEEGFTVDVLIDSGEYSLVKAKMVFSFDPTLITIRKASKNNTLFSQWPDDESALDNINGLVMLTGLTQSGTGELYKTSGDPDVLARIEFDVLTEDKDKDIILSWEFTGSDDPFSTGLFVDGSPPTNILMNGGNQGSRPKDGRYSLGQLTQTFVGPEYIPFIIGGILIIGAGIIISSKPDITRKRYGTVVVYED